MALWPFRRKTVHSPTRTSHLDDIEDSPTRRHGTSPRRTDGRNNRASAPVPRASVRKKQRPEPNKLQRRVRNYSFSPNRREIIQVDPRSRPQQYQHDQCDSPWTRAPTLYLKRDPRHPPVARRKSSKRRHEDHEREAEIKAMSYYMPSLPADRPLHGGGKYSIKRSKTTRHSDQSGKRNSDVSLPLPDSLQSSLSGDSDMTSYQVSIFDSLAPRPTLRYGTGIKRTSSRASASAHPVSPKGLLSGGNAISEEVMHPRKRIDDLADDLDAKALRELMDRDTKRRQRARTREQAKIEKKIADAAERHRQEADDARKSGSPSPSNMERGVIGRELIGLGLDPASTVVTSSRQRTSQSSEPTTANETQAPLQVFHRVDTLPNEDADRDTEASSGRPAAQSIDQQESGVAAPPVSRLSGLLRTKKSRSKSTLASDKDKLAVPNDGEFARKGSEASMGKGARLSISSLLKWNSRNKRGSGPSSFSNTSREEMQAVASAQAQAQAEALAKLQGDDLRSGSADNLRSGSSLSGNYVAGKLSAAPKRTRSRFREDLDDFPTPPDSRVQSPDAEPPMPSIADSNHGHGTQPIPIPGHGMPSAFAQRSVEKLRERALTGGSGSYTAPSPDQNLSMSLASIDSEGSWLSGGAGIRRSGAIRDSLLRANRQAQRDSSPAPSLDEDLGIIEDEYMTRLTPTHQSHGVPKRRSEEGRPSSDEDEGELKWGAVGARPQFIHRVNRGTVHSQQALVNIDSADEESIIEAST
ncbi:hypothetical protein ISF_02802 [Cordyceps fumosorosea ARSEF 2679]|uniref:Uncharacterized protein n=1 Tax=Cordyceps fumosorosea (strain ARSEF 2679) TaxID=1081104 RepID=A0A162JIK8_CORFA|nr:hypothetical protein ISF_02802 [Cordyceps fumosorosea ARSEF 2679]OAA69532.1 hypothetical protein ISF_02802 [Cordyceps fumosorosea ARSEF 2679]